MTIVMHIGLMQGIWLTSSFGLLVNLAADPTHSSSTESMFLRIIVPYTYALLSFMYRFGEYVLITPHPLMPRCNCWIH